jgi:hypothetical protein
MSVDLEILEPADDQVYFCPGEPSAVTQAVHRARLAANWPGCKNCPSRSSVESSNSLSGSRPQIRRTQWGIRGTWQNALTRLKAAQLIGIVTGHLLNERESDSHETETDSGSDSPQDASPDPLTVVMGYDGRASSPDIYAGAVSAAIQNGCHVIDTGRSTASSIQETCRTISGANLGIIVTGAGETRSVTGFDVFDACGQSLSIPWQAWGIRMRRQSEPDGQERGPQIPGGRDAMARLKQSIQGNELSSYPTPSSTNDTDTVTTILELPEKTSGAASRYRVSRRSGTCQSLDTESSFRNWLQKWFPVSLETRVACVCFDPLTAERLEWLFQEAGVAADVVAGVTSTSGAEQLSQRVRETHAQWGICISEDDRFIIMANQHGRCLTAEQLSTWINDSIQVTRPHVTTHVPSDEERVVIMDAGRPNQPASHDVISDGIALMGCVCQIVQSGIPLPRQT